MCCKSEGGDVAIAAPIGSDVTTEAETAAADEGKLMHTPDDGFGSSFERVNEFTIAATYQTRTLTASYAEKAIFTSPRDKTQFTWRPS